MSEDGAPRSARIARATRAGPARPGFAGPGHTAIEVLNFDDWAQANPFVLLMDDTLDFASGQSVGEAHPHAGLETVTMMIEGSLNDPAEGLLTAGDAAWMSAGRGVVHNENVEAAGRARILQVWIALPRAERAALPELQLIPLRTLPVRREPGVEARLYSGATAYLRSPVRNRVPVTLVDFSIEPGMSADQIVPETQTAFFYVLSGSVRVGRRELFAGDVGWLMRRETVTRLRMRAGHTRARLTFFSGARLNEPIVQHGPFVAGSDDEIADQFRAYRAGQFDRVADLAGRKVW